MSVIVDLTTEVKLQDSLSWDSLRAMFLGAKEPEAIVPQEMPETPLCGTNMGKMHSLKWNRCRNYACRYMDSISALGLCAKCMDSDAVDRTITCPVCGLIGSQNEDIAQCCGWECYEIFEYLENEEEKKGYKQENKRRKIGNEL